MTGTTATETHDTIAVMATPTSWRILCACGHRGREASEAGAKQAIRAHNARAHNAR